MMTTDHLFVFNEDQDRFLKLTEEKSLSTKCPGRVHNANFYTQNAADLVQVSMAEKDHN